MTYYIDKDALVAEIEKLKSKVDDGSSYCNGWQHALRKLEIDINTLEVKEVDLEKALIEWHKEHFKKDGTFIGKSGFYLTNNSQMDIAKHFFELGLQVQKGE